MPPLPPKSTASFAPGHEWLWLHWLERTLFSVAPVGSFIILFKCYGMPVRLKSSGQRCLHFQISLQHDKLLFIFSLTSSQRKKDRLVKE